MTIELNLPLLTYPENEPLSSDVQQGLDYSLSLIWQVVRPYIPPTIYDIPSSPEDIRSYLLKTPFPTDILSTITRLDLCHYGLKALADEIGVLYNLKIVNLSHNFLTSLPETIGKCRKLQLVKLNNNRLKTLPDDVKDWKKLIEIDLSDNRLSALPDGVGNWVNLEVILLKNNSLKTLPEYAMFWRKLKILHISGNEISIIPSNIRDNWRSLEYCDIDYKIPPCCSLL